MTLSPNRSSRLGWRRPSRAQTFVEFAMVAPLAVVVMFVSVQLALIGHAAVALGELNYQVARYAALHSDCGITSCTGGETSPKDYMLSVGSPILVQSNASCGGGSCTTITTLTPAAPRNYGDSVQVSLTYTLPPTVLFLPSTFSFIYGTALFPTKLTHTESAFAEGS